MRLAATLDAAVGSDGVTFTYALRNAGTDPVGFQFPTAQAVEVVVYEDEADGDGDEDGDVGGGGDGDGDGDGDGNRTGPVWRYGEGRAFAQVVSEATLAPGEELVRTAAWRSPEPGAYRAVASLTASPDAAAETTVVVEDG